MPKCILIVDDNEANLKLLQAQLEAEKYDVCRAVDGLEALELLRREPVDAVISDILMPRMDGYRLCYELRKDALGYCLFQAGFTLIEHLLRQQQLIEMPGQTLTFDIRDGARLTRVMLADILAVTSAGNYVEFVLADQRRLLMRSPLSAVEDDLSPRGFVRTHRSWLVNEAAVTGLEPEGSGDYGVLLGSLTAPLSRRFPAALAQLRGGKSA